MLKSIIYWDLKFPTDRNRTSDQQISTDRTTPTAYYSLLLCQLSYRRL